MVGAKSQRQEVERELRKPWVATWEGLCEWSEKVP